MDLFTSLLRVPASPVSWRSWVQIPFKAVQHFLWKSSTQALSPGSPSIKGCTENYYTEGERAWDK